MADFEVRGWDDTPIDTSRPILNNADGSISTERTITVEAGGKHYLIPTIVGGKERSDNDAIALWQSGKNPEVGVYASAEEAESNAVERSARIGRERGGADIPVRGWEEPDEATLGTAMQRGIGGLKQGGNALSLGVNQRSLDVMDRIDRGEQVREVDDPVGYQHMDAAQRKAIREQTDRMLGENVADVARHAQAIDTIPEAPSVKRLKEAKSFGEAWEAFKADPVRIVGHIGAESFPQMATGLIGAAMAGPVAGAPAAAAAMGAGSYSSEYASGILQSLQEMGVDLRNPATLRAAVSDPDLMRQVREKAASKASVVGLLDAASGGVASKSLLPAKATATTAGKAANLVVQAPVQGTLGAAGEALGSLASGEEIKPGSVAAEFFGEFAGAPAEVATMAASRVQAQKPVTPPVEVLEAPTVDDAIAAAETALEPDIAAAEAVLADEPTSTTEPLALPHYADPPLVAFPDGSVMTGREAEDYRFAPQPADEPQVAPAPVEPMLDTAAVQAEPAEPPQLPPRDPTGMTMPELTLAMRLTRSEERRAVLAAEIERRAAEPNSGATVPDLSTTVPNEGAQDVAKPEAAPLSTQEIPDARAVESQPAPVGSEPAAAASQEEAGRPEAAQQYSQAPQRQEESVSIPAKTGDFEQNNVAPEATIVATKATVATPQFDDFEVAGQARTFKTEKSAAAFARQQGKKVKGYAPRLIETGAWVLSKPAEAPVAPVQQPDKRQNAAERKRVSEMSPEEMRRELLTSPVVAGLGNRRAWDEARRDAPKPIVASMDVDSLAWVNDNMGHPAGDNLLRTIGQAMQEEGLEGFHISGDEFMAHFDTEASSHEAIERVRSRLGEMEVVATLADGTTITKKGIGFSYGTGQDITAAEAGLQRDKLGRERAGVRAPTKSEPPGVDRKPPGAASEGGVPAAAEKEVVAQTPASTGVSTSENGQQSLFSRGAEAGPGMSIEQVREIAAAVSGAWSNPPDQIKVIATIAEAPPSVREEAAVTKDAQADGVPYAFYYERENTIYLIASEIRSAEQAITGLLHEGLGHYGLRGVFGDKLSTLLGQLASARQDQVKAKATEYGLDILKRDDRLLAAEEVLAELAQSKPEISFVRKAIAIIRTWLRETFPNLNIAMSDDEVINNFIIPARNFVERGNSKSAMAGTTFARGDDLVASEKSLRDRIFALEEAIGDKTRDINEMRRLARKNPKKYSGHDEVAMLREAEKDEADLQKELGRVRREYSKTAKDLEKIPPIEDPRNQLPLFARTKPAWVESGSPELKAAAAKIDTYAPDKSMKEKVKALSENWVERATKEVFDPFVALKKLTPNGYILARMVKSADTSLEATLRFGKPVLNDDGSISGQLDGKGFLGHMSELNGEHDRFFMWVAGNRAERLMGEGREHLFSADEIKAMKNLIRDQGPNDKWKGASTRPQAYAKAAEALKAYNRAFMDIAEKTGEINGESRKLWEHDFYIPFFRVDEDMKIAGPSKVKGLARNEVLKKLKGGTEPLGDLLDNTIRNWQHLLAASLANQAAKKALDAAVNAGVAVEANEETAKQLEKAGGPTAGSTYVMDGGEKHWYTVGDPFVLEAISAFETPSINWAGMKLMRDFKRVLTTGVTASPTFRVRNLARDSSSIIAQNEISYNLVKNVYEGFKATDRNSATYAQAMFGGGVIRFGNIHDGKHAEHAKRLILSGVKEQTILDTPTKIRDAIQTAWDWYQENGDRFENANRMALVQQRLEAGDSNLEAMFAGRDSMDFTLVGANKGVRFLTQVVPFLNARLQGLYKTGRSGVANPKRMAIVTGALTLASIGLMLAYKDDDEWKKRADWDRDTYFWFRIGGVAYRIPKGFELGGLASLAERGLEYFLSDEMNGKRFAERLWFFVGNTLSLNPIPQIGKPLVDLYANTDSFTGRQIETRGMERLTKPERIGKRTTLVAKTLGKAGNVTQLSPVQIDHLIQAYFGWLGTHAAMTVDVMAEPFLEVPKPARKIDDIFIVGDFVKGLPSSQSRYVEDFYKQAKKVHEVMGDLKQARDVHDAEKVRKILEDNKDINSLNAMYSNAERTMTDLNHKIKKLENRKDVGAEEKRARIDELEQRRNKLAALIAKRVREREAARR